MHDGNQIADEIIPKFALNASELDRRTGGQMLSAFRYKNSGLSSQY